MSATPIFPLAQWLTGTNQNSVSANDNALRMEAYLGAALGLAAAVPTGTLADHDQYILTAPWGGMTAGNVAIYLGGTWKEFATYDGMVKPVAGIQYVRAGGAWTATPIWSTVPTTSSSNGTAGQIAYDSGAFYVCVAHNDWARTGLAAW